MNLEIHCGDALTVLKTLPSESVQCCVTSPPYWGLRDYGIMEQIGLEKTIDEYVSSLAAVFSEVHRVLKDDGTLWLNLGDSYARQAGDDSKKEADSGIRTGRTGNSIKLFKSGNNKPPGGLKPKDLIGIPWRVAFAFQADGWYLRSDIIWHKPNPMPESVTDRPTKSHEYIFLLSKSERYHYDADAIQEPAVNPHLPGNTRHKGQNAYCNGDEHHRTKGSLLDYAQRTTIAPAFRNRRDVWTVAFEPYSDAHFATYPPDLIKPCILAGSRAGDTILDPFAGSGTTGMVALELGRKAVLIELNPRYVEFIRNRTNVTPGLAL